MNLLIKLVNYSLFLLGFNGISIFSTDFRKVLKRQTSWKPDQWESIFSQADGQMDGHDEA